MNITRLEVAARTLAYTSNTSDGLFKISRIDFSVTETFSEAPEDKT